MRNTNYVKFDLTPVERKLFLVQRTNMCVGTDANPGKLRIQNRTIEMGRKPLVANSRMNKVRNWRVSNLLWFLNKRRNCGHWRKS